MGPVVGCQGRSVCSLPRSGEEQLLGVEGARRGVASRSRGLWAGSGGSPHCLHLRQCLGVWIVPPFLTSRYSEHPRNVGVR